MGEIEEADEEDSLADVLRAFARHPSVRVLLREAASIIRDAKSKAEGLNPHYAECPPRPPGQRPNNGRGAPPPPRPPPVPSPADDPRVVMGFPPSLQLTETMIKKRRRELAAIYHPDQGGSEEAMKRLNSAVTRLLAQVR